MSTLIDDATCAHHAAAADQTREALRQRNVFCVNLVGGPGCGKSLLIDNTVRRLMPHVRVGIIACDLTSRSSERAIRNVAQVIPLHACDREAPNPAEVRDAVRQLDLDSIDVLFIENIGTLVGPVTDDLGQNVTAAVFSVAGGHDKAEKHAELVRVAGVVLLNKTDLLGAVPFDLNVFRRDVRRLNPDAPLFEVSALHGDGVDGWAQWLQNQTAREAASVSKWFG